MGPPVRGVTGGGKRAARRHCGPINWSRAKTQGPRRARSGVGAAVSLSLPSSRGAEQNSSARELLRTRDEYGCRAGWAQQKTSRFSGEAYCFQTI